VADPREQPDPLAVFRVKRCLKCEYDLAGLPPDHACPECGETFSKDTLCLLGWEQLGQLPGNALWIVRWFWYIFLWVWLMESAARLGFRAIGGWWSWIVPFSLVVGGAVLLWRRIRTRSERHERRWLVTHEALVTTDNLKSYPSEQEAPDSIQIQLDADSHQFKAGRRGPRTWEIRLVTAGTAVDPDAPTIYLRCDDKEAHALAEELRRRVALAPGRSPD
jgi:hypothetical protein